MSHSKIQKSWCDRSHSRLYDHDQGYFEQEMFSSKVGLDNETRSLLETTVNKISDTASSLASSIAQFSSKGLAAGMSSTLLSEILKYGSLFYALYKARDWVHAGAILTASLINSTLPQTVVEKLLETIKNIFTSAQSEANLFGTGFGLLDIGFYTAFFHLAYTTIMGVMPTPAGVTSYLKTATTVDRGVQSSNNIFRMVYNMISKFVNWMYKRITGSNWNEEWNVVEKWMEDTKRLNAMFLSNPNSDIIVDEVSELMEQSYDVVRIVATTPLKLEVDARLAHVRMLSARFMAKSKSGVTRAPPFMAHIFGPSGVGKSTLIREMAAVFVEYDPSIPTDEERLHYLDNLDQCIYNRQVENEFFDALKYNHFICVFDDAFQRRDSAAMPNTELFEIIRSHNTISQTPHMADLTEKGRFNAQFRSILLTSNVSFPTPCESVTHPDAVRRRLGGFQWEVAGTHLDQRFQQYDGFGNKVGEPVNKDQFMDAYSQAILANAASGKVMLRNMETKVNASRERIRARMSRVNVRDAPFFAQEADDTTCENVVINNLRKQHDKLIENDVIPYEYFAGIWEHILLTARDRPDELQMASENFESLEAYELYGLMCARARAMVLIPDLQKKEVVAEHANIFKWDKAGRSFIDSQFYMTAYGNILSEQFGKANQKWYVKIYDSLTHAIGTRTGMLVLSALAGFITYRYIIEPFFGETISKWWHVMRTKVAGWFVGRDLPVYLSSKFVDYKIVTNSYGKPKLYFSIKPSYLEGTYLIKGTLYPLQKCVDEPTYLFLLKAAMTPTQKEQFATLLATTLNTLGKPNVLDLPLAEASEETAQVVVCKEGKSSEEIGKMLNYLRGYTGFQQEAVRYDTAEKNNRNLKAPALPKHIRLPEGPAKSESYTDPQCQAIANSFTTNTFIVEKKAADGSMKRIGSVFAVTGKVFMSFGHLIGLWRTVKELYFTQCGSKPICVNISQISIVVGMNDATELANPGVISPDEYIAFHGKARDELQDLVFFRVNSTALQDMRSMISHFIPFKDQFRLDGQKAQLLYRTETGINTQYFTLSRNRTTTEVLGTSMPFNLQEKYLYEAETAPGYCGSLVLVLNPSIPSKLVGMHVASYTSSTTAMANPVYREQVIQAVNTFSAVRQEIGIIMNDIPFVQEDAEELPEGLIYMGKMPPIYESNKTKIVPSAIHGMVNVPKFEIMHLKSYEKDGQIIDPMWVGMMKYSHKLPTPLPEKWVKNIVRSVHQHINMASVHKMHYLKRVLTIEEAIFGIEGEPAFGGFNRTTSPGYGWSRFGKVGKTHYIQGSLGDKSDPPFIEESLIKAVEERIEWAKQGQRYLTIYQDTLKDERKKIGGKTRLFSNGQMDYNVACRMYFGGFMAWFLKNCVHNTSLVGINMYGCSVDLIAEKLRRYPNIIAGDFKNYDGDERPEILVPILEDYIERFYGDNATDEDRRVRRVLYHDLIYSIHLCRGTLYGLRQSIPSGHPLTSVANTIYNLVLGVLAYVQLAPKDMNSVAHYFKNICPFFYGDDNLIGVHPRATDFYTYYNLARIFKSLGHVYTDHRKCEIIPDRGFDKLQDVAILKRTIQYDKQQQRHIAVLDKEVIEEIPNWTTNSLPILIATRDNVEVGIREAVLHSEKYYDDYVETHNEALEKKNINAIPHESWSYLRSSILESEMAIMDGIALQESGEVVLESQPEIIHTQHQIMDIVDEAESAEGRLPAHIMLPPSRTTLEVRNHTLYNFLEREIKISHGRITANMKAGHNITSIALPHKLLENKMYANKMHGFRFLKANFEVRVMFNAQPFQAGILKLVYFPVLSPDGAFNTSLTSLTRITGLTGMDINLESRESIVLSIPFIYPNGVYDLVEMPDPVAYVRLLVYSPLSADSISYTIYGRFTNVSLSMPTSEPMGVISGQNFAIQESNDAIIEMGNVTITPQQGRRIVRFFFFVGILCTLYRLFRLFQRPTHYFRRSNKWLQESNESEHTQAGGPISKIAYAVRSVAEVFSGIPAIGSFSATVANIAGVVGNIASHFGWSKPRNEQVVTLVRPRITEGFNNYNGVDNSQVMALDALNKTNVTDGKFGSSIDEMVFASLWRVPQYVASFSQSVDQTEEQRLFSTELNPISTATTLGDVIGGTQTYNTTNLGFLASMFSLWRGSLVLTFKVAKTPFHSTRVAIVYCNTRAEPPRTYDPTMTQNYQVIWDLRESYEQRIVIPYIQPVEWLATHRGPMKYYSGYVAVYVLNSLIVTGAASNTINFIVELSAGSDFEVAVPVTPQMDGYHLIPATSLPWITYGRINLVSYPGNSTELEVRMPWVINGRPYSIKVGESLSTTITLPTALKAVITDAQQKLVQSINLVGKLVQDFDHGIQWDVELTLLLDDSSSLTERYTVQYSGLVVANPAYTWLQSPFKSTEQIRELVSHVEANITAAEFARRHIRLNMDDASNMRATILEAILHINETNFDKQHLIRAATTFSMQVKGEPKFTGTDLYMLLSKSGSHVKMVLKNKLGTQFYSHVFTNGSWPEDWIARTAVQEMGKDEVLALHDEICITGNVEKPFDAAMHTVGERITSLRQLCHRYTPFRLLTLSELSITGASRACMDPHSFEVTNMNDTDYLSYVAPLFRFFNGEMRFKYTVLDADGALVTDAVVDIYYVPGADFNEPKYMTGMSSHIVQFLNLEGMGEFTIPYYNRNDKTIVGDIRHGGLIAPIPSRVIFEVRHSNSYVSTIRVFRAMGENFQFGAALSAPLLVRGHVVL